MERRFVVCDMRQLQARAREALIGSLSRPQSCTSEWYIMCILHQTRTSTYISRFFLCGTGPRHARDRELHIARRTIMPGGTLRRSICALPVALASITIAKQVRTSARHYNTIVDIDTQQRKNSLDVFVMLLRD